jgi:hypothetical protein
MTKKIKYTKGEIGKNDLELAISGLRNDNKWLKGLMFVIIGLLVKVAFF